MKYSLILAMLVLASPVFSTDIFTPSPLIEAESEDTEVSWTRFQLFDGCRPMELEVSVSSEAKKVGLTEKSLRIVAESRLRSARLYTTELASRLGVYVERVGVCFTAGVEFKKIVLDLASDVPNIVPMWRRAIIIQSENEDIALNQLSQLVDEFLVEYLRVNESACGTLK